MTESRIHPEDFISSGTYGYCKELESKVLEQAQRIHTLESENGSFQGLIATLEERIAKLERALREALPYIKGEFPAYHHVNLREKIEALLSEKQ